PPAPPLPCPNLRRRRHEAPRGRIVPNAAAPPAPNPRASETGNATAAVSTSERHEPTSVIPASRRVQVHVHDDAVDPAPDHRRRILGGIPGLRVVADGAGLRAELLRDGHALPVFAAWQTTAGRLHLLVRLSLLQRYPPHGLGYRPWTRESPGAPQRMVRHRRRAGTHCLAGLDRMYRHRAAGRWAMSLRTPVGKVLGRGPAGDATSH